MDGKKALQLTSRFALPPNSLGFCGWDSAAERFKNCFINGVCEEVDKELENFIVLHPYLKTIAEISGKSKFSYEVIEAYWLGNDLLKKAQPKHYQILLKNFSEQGVPDLLIKKLEKNPPKNFIPHHLFQVLFVGVGKASQSVPFNLESINNCMIRWGQIVKIEKNKLEINLNSLKKSNIKYKLTKGGQNFSYNPDFLPKLETGKTVAVHWQQPVKILTKKEVKNLSYWTEKILEAFPLSEIQ